MAAVQDLYVSDRNTYELPLYFRKDVFLVSPNASQLRRRAHLRGRDLEHRRLVDRLSCHARRATAWLATDLEIHCSRPGTDGRCLRVSFARKDDVWSSRSTGPQPESAGIASHKTSSKGITPSGGGHPLQSRLTPRKSVGIVPLSSTRQAFAPKSGPGPLVLNSGPFAEAPTIGSLGWPLREAFI